MSVGVLRVAIVGAECTGKTTLARALADACGASLVPEVLRAFVDRTGRVPRDVAEMLAIARQQRALEDRAVEAASVVVCDTSPLLVEVYAAHYFGEVGDEFRAFVDGATYDLVVLAEDDLPWVADGLQRDGESVRAAVQARLRHALDARGLDALRVRGSLDDRLRQVLGALGGSVPVGLAP